MGVNSNHYVILGVKVEDKPGFYDEFEPWMDELLMATLLEPAFTRRPALLQSPRST